MEKGKIENIENFFFSRESNRHPVDSKAHTIPLSHPDLLGLQRKRTYCKCNGAQKMQNLSEANVRDVEEYLACLYEQKLNYMKRVSVVKEVGEFFRRTDKIFRRTFEFGDRVHVDKFSSIFELTSLEKRRKTGITTRV